MHLATVVTALVTIAAGVLGARLIRIGHQADTEDASSAGRLRFLGELAVLIDIISLGLILLEGLYVAVLPGCG
jgi:hypothetical protein